MKKQSDAIEAALVLGAMTGVRSLSGIATVSRRLADHDLRARGKLARTLASETVADSLRVLAIGECIGDKLPFIPPRTDPLPLAGRLILGAVSGYLVAPRRRRAVPALAGAMAALASAFGAYYLRRELTRDGAVPDPIVGLAEDAAVLGAAWGTTRE